MKKTLALLLALAMICCAVSCFAETAEATLLMTLYLQKASFDGGETFKDTETLGANLAFALYEDGTVVGINASPAGEINMVGGWTQDENFNVILAVYPEGGSEEEAEVMVLAMMEDGTIMGTDNEGTVYVFGNAPADLDVPELVPVEDASVLNGTWMFVGVMSGADILSVEQLLNESPDMLAFLGYNADDPYMTVADDTVTVFGSVMEGFALTDGQLVLPLGDEEMELSVTLSLLDNGCACFTELGVPMLFVPVQ